MRWWTLWKNFSSIEEELMYVNKKEEEEKLKNTDIKLAHNDGKIEGELASKKETIKNLTDMKMPSKQIAIAVNLPVKEVEKIQKEQKKN